MPFLAHRVRAIWELSHNLGLSVFHDSINQGAYEVQMGKAQMGGPGEAPPCALDVPPFLPAWLILSLFWLLPSTQGILKIDKNFLLCYTCLASSQFFYNQAF